MGFKDLFQRLKAFDNEPAFRNVNDIQDKSAFDDLLDPEDDADASTSLAFREANRMRSAELTSFNDLYVAAILKVFQVHSSFATRYSDGSYPAWYGCTQPETTIWETVYHMVQEEVGRRGHPKVIERQRIVFEVSCTAILIDLTGETPYLSKLTDPTSYSFTQQVGNRVRSEGHPGLIAPCARQPDGKNLVVFQPNVLSDPKVVRQLRYQLDPNTMMVDVLDASNQKTLISIDGKSWIG